MTLSMPPEFMGCIEGDGARCGICSRVVTVSRDPERAKRELREFGWTWRHDTGWTCTCRHSCGNLDPTQDPLHKPTKRPRNRRHGQRARVRRIIKRRNRNEIE